MKENVMRFVLRLRTLIYIASITGIILAEICHFAFANPTSKYYLIVEERTEDDEVDSMPDKCFWPPDMIPHPHPPQPEPDPKDRIV